MSSKLDNAAKALADAAAFLRVAENNLKCAQDRVTENQTNLAHASAKYIDANQYLLDLARELDSGKDDLVVWSPEEK